MRKRLVAAALCAVMALALLPTAALAAPATVWIGSAELTAATPYYHNGAGGAQGTATDVATDYNAYFDATTGTLTLDGLNISSNETGIRSDGDIIIELTNANTVTSTGGYGVFASSNNNNNDSNITINGAGSLNVTALYSGICGAAITFEEGTVNAHTTRTDAAGNKAIDADGAITVQEGSVTAVTENGPGIFAGSSAGSLTISGGTVSATGNNVSNGIYTRGAVTISGGTTTATGDANGIYSKSLTITGGTTTAYGAKALWTVGADPGDASLVLGSAGKAIAGRYSDVPGQTNWSAAPNDVADGITEAKFYRDFSGYHNNPSAHFSAISAAVTLYPTSGSTGVTLNAANPYFVNNAAAYTGTLGENDCTAYFHDGTLELKGMDLNGAGATVNSVYSAVYSSSGDLTIKLHGDNRIAMTAATASSVQARALYVRKGSLTFTGDGALNVSTGNGYGTLSAAVACADKNTCVTVDSGVSLTAKVGSSTGTDKANYGIYAEMLLNHGTISATGEGAGIYLNSSGSPISVSDGKLTAEGTTGSGLIISEDDTFMVNGGMVELKGAANQPAIGKTPYRDEPGILALGPSVTNGLLGAASTSAAVFSAEDIRAKYKSAAPVYSYMRLPASPAAPASASGGPSVYYKGGNTFGASRSDAPTAVLINNTPVPFSANNGVITVSSMPAGANWVTVRWNSTSATTNFTPNGVVTAISNVELPKTGDASVLAMALCGLAAAAAVFKRR